MTDELKKADEIVRALRDYASDCDDCDCLYCDFAYVCGKCGSNAPKIIADLIESLTSQLAESQRREKAAVEDLVHDCSTCGRYEKCTDEWFKSDMNEDRCSCSGWQWRGPQEAEKGEAE